MQRELRAGASAAAGWRDRRRSGVVSSSSSTSSSSSIGKSQGLKSIKVQGRKVWIPKGDDISARYIAREVFEKESYLAHGVCIGEGDQVVDVGANVGLFALYCTDIVGETGRILCYEPADLACRALEANTKEYPQVCAQPVALSNRSGVATLTTYAGASGWGTLKPDGEGVKGDVGKLAENLSNNFIPGSSLLGKFVANLLLLDEQKESKVKVDTLGNQLVALEDFLRGKPIDLLKIDVERSECEVLEGLGQRDWSRIRQIVAEVHDIDGGLDKFREILEAQDFLVVANQSKELKGSQLYNVFAVRDSSETTE